MNLYVVTLVLFATLLNLQLPGECGVTSYRVYRDLTSRPLRVKTYKKYPGVTEHSTFSQKQQRSMSFGDDKATSSSVEKENATVIISTAQNPPPPPRRRIRVRKRLRVGNVTVPITLESLTSTSTSKEEIINANDVEDVVPMAEMSVMTTTEIPLKQLEEEFLSLAKGMDMPDELRQLFEESATQTPNESNEAGEVIGVGNHEFNKVEIQTSTPPPVLINDNNLLLTAKSGKKKRRRKNPTRYNSNSQTLKMNRDAAKSGESPEFKGNNKIISSGTDLQEGESSNPFVNTSTPIDSEINPAPLPYDLQILHPLFTSDSVLTDAEPKIPENKTANVVGKLSTGPRDTPVSHEVRLSPGHLKKTHPLLNVDSIISSDAPVSKGGPIIHASNSNNNKKDSKQSGTDSYGAHHKFHLLRETPALPITTLRTTTKTPGTTLTFSRATMKPTLVPKFPVVQIQSTDKLQNLEVETTTSQRSPEVSSSEASKLDDALWRNSNPPVILLDPPSTPAPTTVGTVTPGMSLSDLKLLEQLLGLRGLGSAESTEQNNNLRRQTTTAAPPTTTTQAPGFFNLFSSLFTPTTAKPATVPVKPPPTSTQSTSAELDGLLNLSLLDLLKNTEKDSGSGSGGVSSEESKKPNSGEGLSDADLQNIYNLIGQNDATSSTTTPRPIVTTPRTFFPTTTLHPALQSMVDLFSGKLFNGNTQTTTRRPLFSFLQPTQVKSPPRAEQGRASTNLFATANPLAPASDSSLDLLSQLLGLGGFSSNDQAKKVNLQRSTPAPPSNLNFQNLLAAATGGNNRASNTGVRGQESVNSDATMQLYNIFGNQQPQKPNGLYYWLDMNAFLGNDPTADPFTGIRPKIGQKDYFIKVRR